MLEMLKRAEVNKDQDGYWVAYLYRLDRFCEVIHTCVYWETALRHAIEWVETEA